MPLGKRWVERGFEVKGSTTRVKKLDDIKEGGIKPYRLRLTPAPENDPSALLDADVLFVNVPPPRDVNDRLEYHMQQMTALRVATTAEWVIFASSTGVYPDTPTDVTEEDLPPGGPPRIEGERRGSGEILQEVEGMWDEAAVDTTILRFGGLYGPDRHPGRFLAGRTGLARPHAPVNLIHLDDCIGLVEAVFDANARNEVFNAVAPEHPTRKETYTRAAAMLGLEPPQFASSDERSGKSVRSRKSQMVLEYTYQHPNPAHE
jgi:nucleoside-diphosphate-sugar epimerase